MTFTEKLARASRDSRDVRILLNRALLRARAAIEERVALAGQAGWLGTAPDELQAELAEFDARIADEFVVVRVVELPQSQWRRIQAANPAGDSKHPVDRMYGFAAVAATIDAVEAGAVIVEGDDTYTPSSFEWAQVWDAINTGDMARLTEVVVDLNEATGYQDYQRVGKQ